MAVGDIIVGSTSAASTYTNYQPSSGVELVVTSVTGYDEGRFGQYNGTDYAGTRINATSVDTGFTKAYGQMANIKVGITNTYYFRFYTTSSLAYFSAIQTK